MKAQPILTTEIDYLKISSLPSRPTAPTAYGGRGLSSKEMRQAFDKLSLFIIERFNNLLSDVESGELAASLVVDSDEGTTLLDIVNALKGGAASLSLSYEMEDVKARLSALEEKYGE